MQQMMSLPATEANRREYADWQGLYQDIQELGLDGVEAIWGGEELLETLPRELVVGYHLTFFPDWLDLYREDRAALVRKFGSMDTVRMAYGGCSGETLLEAYRADLARAEALSPAYVVFHVSDVSLEENYTYRWEHSHAEVLQGAVEVINLLLDGRDWPFRFLVENQWWPGFTFTQPEQTARLLEGIHYPGKGIMLDTGHLMNTQPALHTEAEGVAYIHQMLDRHGALCEYIAGLHLHRSLSGAYAIRHTGRVPENFPPDYLGRFGMAYQHVLRLDEHLPWEDRAVRTILERLEPLYVTHELSASGRRQRRERLQRQQRTLWGP